MVIITYTQKGVVPWQNLHRGGSCHGYTYTQAADAVVSWRRVRSVSMIQTAVFPVSVTSPPLTMAFSTEISLMAGKLLSMVTPSEHTGLDGSRAWLNATTVTTYTPSPPAVYVASVSVVSIIWVTPKHVR